MDYQTFKETLIELLEESLPEGRHIQQQPITKLNKGTLDGLIIADNEHAAHPTFYMNHLYEAYENGTDIDHIINMLLEAAETPYQIENIGEEFLMDFGNVSDRICCRLVNAEMNKEMLSTLPHVDFLDLAIIFYVYMNCDDGYSQLVIPEALMTEWGMTVPELIPLATENTRRLNPPKNFLLSEAIPRDMLPDADNSNMARAWVMTGETCRNGAIYMLDTEKLTEYAEKLNDDLIIIPCSIHEVFIMPAREIERDHMDRIIKSVNTECLQPEDYLSDHSYMFSRATRQISL